MKEVKSYYKIKESIYDSQQDEKTAKINFYVTYDNKRKIDDFTISYCTLGICDSNYKPCANSISLTSCPYLKTITKKRPRKNSKDYEVFKQELKLQMIYFYLNDFINEKLIQAINGQLNDEEYQQIVNEIADKIDDYYAEQLSKYHKIGSDILVAKKINESQKLKEKEKNKQVLFEIGDYFYIKIRNLPDVFDDNRNSLWYLKTTEHGWVKKENFTKSFYEQLKNGPVKAYVQFNRFSDYFEDLKLLEKQLEEKYGMITIFNLED